MGASRRQFLTTTLLAAAGAGLARQAAALSIEPADAATAAGYRAALACRDASVWHARLTADATAALAGRTLTDGERQAILAAFACPVCGCGPRLD